MATTGSCNAARQSAAALALIARSKPWTIAVQLRGSSASKTSSLISPRYMATTPGNTSLPELKSVQNFRDVASSSPATINAGLLFRTARLDTASAADWKTLQQNYGVRSTIDLRSEDEQKTSPPANTNIQHHRININGSSYSRALIAHLSVWNQARLLFNAATGKRDRAIQILGANAMKPRGLVGLATDTLDASGKEIREVFGLLSSSANYPICIYCHQGKDRTGIIITLVLLLCRVDARAVQADYARSTGDNGLTQSELAERVKELQDMGLPAEFAGTDEAFVEGVQRHCQKHYGSVEQYLGHIGVTEDMSKAVRNVLLKK
ncbi:hypothetical protein FH972_021258 [Carpinus fangiana]|uniref:Tyrosine specific protein phosphatases domain-containing protein n=1 Tax=Carpinus fangiana TaxID=176857 RepID=A0A5N6KP68_9ROSI|nr:hypothetical protein FH972_021258 [Carpinus fangiana]